MGCNTCDHRKMDHLEHAAYGGRRKGMQIRYFKGKSNELPAGTVSEVSWDNPVVAQAMCLIFKPREHEEMVEVLATEDGIRAYFRFKPGTPSSEENNS